MAGGGYPFDEFRKEAFLSEDGDVMSNFITRMVNRTFGLGEVVQPLTTSVFAEEKNIMEDRPGVFPREKKNSDVTEKHESLPFAEIQQPSGDVEAGEKSSFPKRSKHAKESLIPESNIIAKPDKTLGSKGYYENTKNRDTLSPRPEKAEKHTGLPTHKKSGSVIPGQMEASKTFSDFINSGTKPISKKKETESNMPVSEKKTGNMILGQTAEEKHMPDVKRYERKERKVSETDSSEPTTLMNNSRIVDGKDHSLASKGFIRSESVDNFEQPIPSITDRLSEQRRTLSATPTIKVTIGRIDVRAVMQKAESTPLRRVVPPKPKLSLDDYLKQRSGGER